MKFKFDGVEKKSSKAKIFSRNFERTQNVEMRSRSWSLMKVDEPRSNHISQTFQIDHLTKEEKNQTISKDQTLTKISLFVLRMI